MLPRASIFKKSLIGQETTGKELFVKINSMLKMTFFFHTASYLPPVFLPPPPPWPGQ